MARLLRSARSLRHALLPCILVAASLSPLSCGNEMETVLTDPVEDACAELGRKCHGVAGAEDCHDIGHQRNDAACRAVHSECLQRCENPGPAGGGAGGSGTGTAGIGGWAGNPSGGALNAGGVGGTSGTSGAAGSAGSGGTGAGGTGGGASGTGGSSAALPECELLATNCGRVDSGSGAAHECVLTGMSGDASACAAQLESCTQSCGEAACLMIGALCHDSATPLALECHDLGHEAAAAACFDRVRECLDECSPE